MHGNKQFRNLFLNIISRVTTAVLAIAVVFALTLVLTQSAQAQTFRVIHKFTGGADGATPYAGVTVASSGVLYGTASAGGIHGAGTVFKLSQVNSSWVFSPLYEFTGGSDGADPLGGVVIGPNGALYGTTADGGAANYGTVFELRPPATFCRSVLCYWDETVLHTFTGYPDGEYPQVENLAFDGSGNIYGTTGGGGYYNNCDPGGSCGTVFELTPSGGGYTESIIHNFGSGSDGYLPTAGVVLDTAGNLYGTTLYGGAGGCVPIECGTAYQLIPSNGGWVENVLVNFGVYGTGANPFGNLIIDGSGNLYGTASINSNGIGAVFKLAPSGGGFTYSALGVFSSGCLPLGGLAMDAAGNLFGVCYNLGAHQDGWIFELTNCSETCTVVDLHDFSGSDGANPWGGPVLDASGNLYGTTYGGGNTGGPCGSNGCGVVWEITP